MLVAGGLLVGCVGVVAAPMVLTGPEVEPVAAPAVAAVPLAVPATTAPAPGDDATGPSIVASTRAALPAAKPRPMKPSSKPHYTILQIGDSHTAADFFTGRVRQQLQKLFGAGGLYLPPGLPHAGIRSDSFTINVSPGWEYQSMAKSAEKDRFWLTGYSAASTAPDAEISFTSKKPVSFDAIDVSFLRQPGAGSVDISIDGTLVDQVALDGPDGEPFIRRLLPYARTDTFRKLAIRSTSAAPVALTGVLVDQRLSGVSYLSVGFPGATINILERMSSKNLADDVTRIAPDMIVLAFGTNEGFDDDLDLARYRSLFRDILHALTSGRPDTLVVVVGPPAGARKNSCADGEPAASATGKDSGKSCWMTPKNLDAVRAIQKEVAAAEEAVFWDWSQMLPSAADLRQGRRGNPALYAADRVHLTRDGYQRTADAFAAFLTPYVKKGLAGR